jgi:hypothetical protein
MMRDLDPLHRLFLRPVLSRTRSIFSANLPIDAQVLAAIHDWTGFYVAGQVDYGQDNLACGTNFLFQAEFSPQPLVAQSRTL